MHANKKTFLNSAKIDFSYIYIGLIVKTFIFFRHSLTLTVLRSIRILLIPRLFRRALAFDFTDPLTRR